MEERKKKTIQRARKKEGVRCQPQTEKKRGVAGLLANEKAVAPALRFLMATEVCRKARELEWEAEK